jgi:hypothetical protein
MLELHVSPRRHLLFTLTPLPAPCTDALGAFVAPSSPKAASGLDAVCEEWVYVAALAKEHQADKPRVPRDTPPSRCPQAEIEFWREVTNTLGSLHAQVPVCMAPRQLFLLHSTGLLVCASCLVSPCCSHRSCVGSLSRRRFKQWLPTWRMPSLSCTSE